MMKKNESSRQEPLQHEDALRRENRIHDFLVLVLLVLMSVEWIVLLLQRHWLSVFLVTLIIATLLSPFLFKQRMEIEIPAEFHLAAVLFILASLYLGEIRGFYLRFWWWDVLLHTSAGLLTGILGFLLVYVLNESKRVELHMTAGFIALFAFAFAVATGSIWEIFEFSVDRIIGAQMQKPMFDDPSGLTDTMWDMIVNAAGAALISLAGWWYLKTRRNFFLKEWIRKFIRQNPNLFSRKNPS